MAVLLDSPNFVASRWTAEELARVNISQILILQILWPGQTENASAAFSSFYPLVQGDFEGTDTIGPTARLQESCLSMIVDSVESLRARALGTRHAFLVREFLMEAERAGLTVYTTIDRTLLVSAPTGGKVLVRPRHRRS